MTLPAEPGTVTGMRLLVLRAMLLLVCARFLVRFVALARWRDSLGTLHGSESAPPHPTTPLRSEEVALLARSVERASRRLPRVTRCLPRAMVVQWLMRRAGLPSRIVIAVHATDRTSEDAYHAWVEYAGEMVIGICNRSDYRPIAILDQDPAIAATRRRLAG